MTEILEIIYGEKSEKVSNKLYVNEKDFEIPHGDDYKIAIKELEIIQKQTLRGKQFLSLFEYDDASLWWLIYQSLIPKYKQLTNFIEKFSNLLDELHPEIVKIEHNFDKIHLIREICKHKKIKVQYSNVTEAKKKSKGKLKKIIQKRRFAKITKIKSEKRKKLFFNKFEKINSIQNKTLFVIPSSYRRNIYDHKNENSDRGEHLLQPLIDSMDKTNILGIDLDYSFKGDFDILSERLDDTSLKWAPLDIFLQSNIDHSAFIEKYSKIINDHEFQKFFSFRNIHLWNYLQEFFQSMTYAPYLPFYLTVIDSLETTFRKNLPRAIFLPYETGSIALAIILVAKKFGIKTIGIQHGHIYQYNPMYSFTKFQNQDNPLDFIIPDKILLFGNTTKNLLVKNGYPEENLVVFGNPNFFDIQKIDTILSKKPLRKKYGISIDKKIILFATGKLQPYYSNHGVYDYDVQIWKHLLENFQNRKDYFIILKPHPQETNIEIYTEILKKYNNSNAIIFQENIIELIYISSLVISVFSSTMLDSLCFNKPVIRVEFQGSGNPIFDDTSAILKSTLENLSKNIHKLEDEQTREHLLKDVKQFVFENYGIPEKDVINLIKQILDNNL